VDIRHARAHHIARRYPGIVAHRNTRAQCTHHLECSDFYSENLSAVLCAPLVQLNYSIGDHVVMLNGKCGDGGDNAAESCANDSTLTHTHARARTQVHS
jgi:hypothetical protein